MDKRISQLELVTEIDQNDVLPIVNGGTTKKIKISQLASGNTNLSYTPSPTNGKVNSDTGTDATIPLTTETDAGLFSPAEKTKLAGIQTGAQANVNADWNATSGDAQILNKPDFEAQTLAETLVLGNTTDGENISISNGDAIILDNGSMLKKGTIDAGNGGSKGISQICGVGFEHKWEAGRLYIMNDGGTIIREVSHNLTYTPTVTDDVTKGFVQNTRWILDNGDLYICTDPTEGVAVWELQATQVNSDWDATSGVEKILNKPTIPDAQIQSDWTQANTSALDYIKNKPTIPTAVTQTSQLTNNGADGVNPFITALDIPTTGQASTLVREVKNMTGATLTKGTVVYISGANGNKPLVSKALATTDALSSRTFGLLQSNILNNGLGYCVIIGDLNGLDTSSFSEGAQLYLSGVTAGTYTATKTLAPTHLVYVGKVTRSHPTQGQIEIGIQNGYELGEIHDVALSSEENNQVLAYESSTDLWKNKSIGTILGFTPYRYIDTARVNVSGTLNESILNTIVINPNTFNTTDLMKVMWKNAKTTSLGTVNIRLRSNTTNSLVGATLLATSSMGTTNRTAVFLRNFDLIAGTINGFDSGTAIASDITVSTSNPSSNVYNTNNVLYLFTTIQLTNVGDTVTSNFVNITN